MTMKAIRSDSAEPKGKVGSVKWSQSMANHILYHLEVRKTLTTDESRKQNEEKLCQLATAFRLERGHWMLGYLQPGSEMDTWWYFWKVGLKQDPKDYSLSLWRWTAPWDIH